FHHLLRREFFDRGEKVRLPNAAPHLQRLDQKFALDHAANPGFEVEKVISAPAFVRDPDKHALDVPHEVGATARRTPKLPGERFELKTKRPANRPRAGERLQLPELGARFVVGAEGFQRTNQRPFLAIWPEPGIERSEAAFRTRLPHSCNQVLRCARLLTDKKNIEIRAASNFATTE